VPGRHRKQDRFRGYRATAVVVALLCVAVVGVGAYHQLTRPTCTGEERLSVAAAPEIAPALQDVVTRWTADHPAIEGRCLAVDVSAVEPADVAAAIADKHGVNLTGVGRASGSTAIPDVWVPDSSTWLLRLRAPASGFTVPAAPSIARSPVVVAMPEPVAGKLGWPDKKLGWADLLGQMASDATLHTGIVEPTRDASGLSGLLALASAAGAAPDAQAATTGALRALAAGRSALREDLLARFPRSADPASIASALSAAPLSEQAVIEYNAAKPPIPLAALYLDPAPIPLDYPYALLPGTDPTRAAVADALRSQLSGSYFADRLAALGLRAGDGSAGAGFATPRGGPAPAAAAPTPSPSKAGGAAAGGADPTLVDRALSTWTAVTVPGRMLAVIDVSGSMLEKVPTAHNATRDQVTREAARRGLDLFDDSWAVGLWVFSTKLVGQQDYRQLVPIGPLSGQRAKLEAALDAIRPKPTGDTGLYDTILAAYRTVQQGWDPGRVNSVVVLTDGINDDDNGITRAQLIDQLKKASDPKRPIQVVILGIGDAVDPAELSAITDTTGGGVFVTEDPAKIGDIFLKAISLRAAR
jgi:Ca-activated chloride channel family protein